MNAPIPLPEVEDEQWCSDCNIRFTINNNGWPTHKCSVDNTDKTPIPYPPFNPKLWNTPEEEKPKQQDKTQDILLHEQAPFIVRTN